MSECLLPALTPVTDRPRSAWSTSPWRARLLHSTILATWGMVTPMVLASGLLLPMPAWAGSGLPKGGQVVAGAASITTGANRTTIRQTTDTAIIEWDAFSVAHGKAVVFNNGDGATLSRVTGNVPSRIDGAVSATGSLYLVNPSGVVVDKTGTVSTGGTFAATTHDVADKDFRDGGALTFTGNSQAEVINHGRISSAQGDVALMARKVSNAGTIAAPEGTATLAAGYDIRLADTADQTGAVSVRIGGSDTAAVNTGTITAATVAMRASGGNVYALAGNTDAVVKATGIAEDGGRIFLTAGPDGSVTVDGRLDASGPQAGTVSVTGGDVTLTGAIDASASGSGQTGGEVLVIADQDMAFSGRIAARGGKGGKGGFVETSGSHVDIGKTATVDTRAPEGPSGTWLIDPYNVTISSAASSGMSGFDAGANGSVLNVTTLTNALATTGVTVTTGSGGSQAGNITVSAPISWSADTTLTLNAAGSIYIDAPITASGAHAGLALVYGSGYELRNGSQVTLSGTSASLSIGGTAYTLIHDVDDLQALSGSGPFALAEDIDASATATWNGGAGFVPLAQLTSGFTGLNHSISGLTINRPDDVEIGLFSRTASGTTVRDLRLEDAAITGSLSVGGVAGVVNGTLSRVAVEGSISGTSSIGGLTGSLWGTIRDSHAEVTVSGQSGVGGLAGTANSSTIQRSYATGSVTASGNGAGGLAGYYDGGISNSYATASVSAAAQAGGIVGNHGSGTISTVYASGAVSAGTQAGGLVGLSSGTVSNSYFDSQTTGQAQAIGTDYGTSSALTAVTSATARTQSTYSALDFTNTWVMVNGSTRPFLRSEYATTITTAQQLQLVSLDLSATYRLGADIDLSAALATDANGLYSGLWGAAGFGPLGTNGNPFYGTFDGQNHGISGLTINRPTTGYVGLFGYLSSATVKDLSLENGSITALVRVGGLAGYATGSTISNVHSGIDITAMGSDLFSNGTLYSVAGGLVGSNLGVIENSSASGTVTAVGMNVGGLAGVNTGASAVIRDSYATGDVTVTGGTYTGGLVGQAGGSAILRSYATGNVSGGTAVGGLIGISQNGAALTEVFASGNVSGSTMVGGLVGSNSQASITNAYASGSVTGGTVVGGLIGSNYLGPSYGNAIANTYASGAVSGTATVGGYIGNNYISSDAVGTITASYWNTTTSGRSSGLNGTAVAGLSGQTTAGMQALSTFSGDGWDIDDAGGTGAVWRIYDGYTAPLLRTFMTALTVTGGDGGKTYDGSTSGSDVGGLTYSLTDTDSGQILGTAAYTASSANAGSYTGGDLALAGLYSTQFGYDLTLNAGSLTIDKAALTITVAADGKTYDGLAYSGGNGVTYSGFVNGETTSVLGGSLSYGGTAQGATNAGTYTLTASGLSSGNYDITYANGAVTIDKAALTVTVADDGKTYDGLAYSGGNGVTYSGFVNGETTSVLSGSLSYGGTAQGATNAGTYTLNASGLTSGNYDITYVSGDVVIDKAALTVTVRNAGKTYNGLAYRGGNGVTYSGLVNGQTAAVLGGSLTYGGTAQGATNAGTYTLTASGLTSGNYDITYVGGTLRVDKAALTVTASADSKTYDGLAYAGGNGATYRGLVNGQTAAVLGGSLTYGGTAQGATNAGTYTLTASGLTSANYDITYIGSTLRVDKAPLTITAHDAGKTYDGLAYTGGNGVTYSGLVNGETTAVLSGSLTYGGSAQGATNAGRHTIRASGLSADNYAITYVNGTLSIDKAPLTITAHDAGKTYDGLAYAGGNGVTYRGFVNGETTAVLSGSLTYGGSAQGAVNAGAYTLTAGGLSSGNYAITYADGTLVIDKAPLIITARNDGKTYDGTAYRGGNGVTYAGLVNGETAAALAGSLTYGGTAQGAVNAGAYTLTAGGLSSGNYAITYLDGALSIAPSTPEPTPSAPPFTALVEEPSPYGPAQRRSDPAPMTPLRFVMTAPPQAERPLPQEASLPTPDAAPSATGQEWTLSFAPGTFAVSTAMAVPGTGCAIGVAGESLAAVPYPCNASGVER